MCHFKVITSNKIANNKKKNVKKIGGGGEEDPIESTMEFLISATRNSLSWPIGKNLESDF